VLAEHLGDTEQNFAANMTAKAHALGMYNTHFMNATGLPNNFQVTTPRDMAVLAWKAQRNFPEFYHYFAAHSFNFKGTELRGINKFTANYPGAEGMKTGFTCGSGFNLIGAAHQNGKRLIGVVMGGMTSKERYQLMMQKMDAGFAHLTSAAPTRNINTMPTGSAGSPPYQLDCGNRGGAVPRTIPVSNRSYHKSKHKTISRVKTNSKGTTKPQLKTVTRPQTGVKPVTKSKVQPQAAIQAKSKNFHQPKAGNKASNKKTSYHRPTAELHR
jgi:D-alanyl-D-alanine carboxypeptidase